MGLLTEAESLITDARLSAHLATSVGDRPHVAPVWYVYDDGFLSVVTGGTKLRNVRRNPRIAASIERAGESGVKWGVTLQGTARIVKDEERVRAIQRALDEKYEVDDYESEAFDDDESGSERTDGGAEFDWEAVEIEAGSGTLQRY